jgi:hypothetical protein
LERRCTSANERVAWAGREEGRGGLVAAWPEKEVALVVKDRVRLMEMSVRQAVDRRTGNS